MNTDFIEECCDQLISYMFNDHDDNWDHIRFGQIEQKKRKGLRRMIQKYLNNRGYYHLFTIRHLILKSRWIERFKYLYDNLEYDQDRKLLIQVLAYRVLGHRKVKLPLNTPEFWSKIDAIEDLCDKSDTINPHFLHFTLLKANLRKINIPIEFYFTPGGIFTDFILKQYEYNNNGNLIKADPGDIVIDGGGCWGDTALYFANEVGPLGKVFSFEFIPENIKIFERNISLNKDFLNIVELVNKPLWRDSSTRMYFKDQGPGSKVSINNFEGSTGKCDTLCIDDLVYKNNLSRIDFIKMDIEGAELDAINGARESIRKYRPKLAIALYHSVDDFETIPLLIKELVPEYKFYFSHCSINEEESILFAKVK
jgi:FkbM family methyltransferase